MGSKFQVGDRIRVNEALFPSYHEGLFDSLAKAGVVVAVDEESILPCHVRLDGFEHHPFWFYENQLLFEDRAKEEAWAKSNAPKVRPPGAKPAPSKEAAP